MAQQHHQLFVFSLKQPGKRLVAGLCNDTLPYPLPELCLRRPELFAVAAHYERCLLPLLLPGIHALLLADSIHFRNCMRNLHPKNRGSSRGTPKGSLYARQH